MDMEITPQVGVGRLMLGMSREDARRALPGLRDISRKVMKVELMEDFSEADGIEVHYMDNKERTGAYVISIAIMHPARPRLFGQSLLGMSFDDALDWMEKIDPECYEEDNCVCSPTHGVDCAAADLDDDPNAPITCITIWDPCEDI